MIFLSARVMPGAVFVIFGFCYHIIYRALSKGLIVVNITVNNYFKDRENLKTNVNIVFIKMINDKTLDLCGRSMLSYCKDQQRHDIVLPQAGGDVS